MVNIPHKPKRALILSMGALILLGLGIANVYFNYENNAVDPRIIEARALYETYDDFAEVNNFKAIFSLLDSIEVVYNEIDHYQKSFELGVIYNNRTAAFLSMAIYFDSNSLSLDGITTLTKDTLLALSEEYALKSISLYENWIEQFEHKEKPEIKAHIESVFLTGLEAYPEEKKIRFLSKRVKEIQEAKLETPRRLSVAYTNLGIVKRHMEKYEESANLYKKAIELWDRNLAAENNLNTLLGRPLKKQNMLEKIFPPDRKKKE